MVLLYLLGLIFVFIFSIFIHLLFYLCDCYNKCVFVILMIIIILINIIIIINYACVNCMQVCSLCNIFQNYFHMKIIDMDVKLSVHRV